MVLLHLRKNKSPEKICLSMGDIETMDAGDKGKKDKVFLEAQLMILQETTKGGCCCERLTFYTPAR